MTLLSPYRGIVLCFCIMLSALSCSQKAEVPENANTHANVLAQAEEALEREDFQQAVILYTKLLSGGTDQALAYTKRAAAYIGLQQYEAALKDINNALLLDPEYLEAYYLRGVTYELDPQQTQSGQQYFIRAAKGQATTAADYLVRGKAYLFLGQPKQAVEALNQAINLNPNDAFLYYWRARVWQASNNAEQALADFTEALAHAPEKAAFYYDRGRLYQAAEYYQEAIQDFSSALAFAPDKAEYAFARGQAHAALFETDNALRDFTRAITLAPDRESYVCMRGQLHELSSQYQAALDDYARATELNPDDACGYLGRGSVYATLGDYQQALIEYNEFQKRSARLDESFYSNRAAIYENLGHYDQALADYTEAIQLAPYKAFLYYSRGMLHAMLEDFAHAGDDCENALLLDDGQGNCLAHFCLGVVYTGRQDAEHYRRAREHYSQALNPECYVHTYQFIANTYVRIGMLDTVLGAAPDEIIETYQAALANQSDHVYAYVLLGDQMPDEQAIALYSKAISLEPEYAVPYLKRGLAHKRVENIEQARLDFQQARRLAIRSTWRQRAEEQLLLLELSEPLASPTPLPPAAAQPTAPSRAITAQPTATPKDVDMFMQPQEDLTP